uniref:Uncharacterized protein n=1 Tax=Photinus pyralis TaxID=7054 RepID=A0A1Y1L610_PHOPY
MNRRSDHGETSPENHHGREPEARLDIVKGQVGRHLTNDIANGEASIDFIKLVAHKAKIILHARYVGVGKIAAVKVVDQVAETAKGEDEEVNLLDELPFSGLILYMKVLAKS